MNSSQLAAVLLLIPVWLPVGSVTAGDWPQFLGPDRNGVSAETGLLSRWPADGPRILWRTPLGVSMSGIAVSGDRAYTMYQDESSQFLAALDATNGKAVWQTPIAPVYLNAMGNGPRATPTVSGEQIFVFTGEGILAACDRKSGKKLWAADVPKLLDTTPSEYGMSCSPLIVGDQVIVFAGSDTAAIAAFETKSGKQTWTAGQGRAGYSSPTLMTVAGRSQIVALTGSALCGLDPQSGKALWTFPFVTDYDCNTACPVQIDTDRILISAGEDHGTSVVLIESDGTGFHAAEDWSSLGKGSALRAEWQTPVLHDGYLYGLDNNGGAGPITNLTCLRLSDHKVMWQERRFGKSNLILADGKLFVTTMKGEVVIVAATPTSFSELSRATIIETTRQAPALAGGRLFVRDDKEVVCIDLAARAGK